MTGSYEVDVEAKDGLTAGVRRPDGGEVPVYLAVLSVDRETALDARFWKAVQEMVVRAAEALREMKVKGKKRGKK